MYVYFDKLYLNNIILICKDNDNDEIHYRRVGLLFINNWLSKQGQYQHTYITDI